MQNIFGYILFQVIESDMIIVSIVLKQEQKTGNRGSPIPGVQMLELHKLGNFPMVQQQLHAAMKAKYGPVADVIKGNPKYVPQMTNYWTQR